VIAVLRRLRLRARALLRPSGAERDLQDELRGHLERRVEELITAGMPRAAAPAGFDFYGTANPNNDIFTAIGRQADLAYMQARDSRPGLVVVGRMRAGMPRARAAADLAGVAAQLAVEHPSTNANVGVALASLLDDYIGDARQTLWMLLTAALIVLAIACANIANLLLSRSSPRTREIAMRVALGAGRGRIVRQLLTEHLILALFGGALGVLAGWWGTAALTALAAPTLPRLESVALDWRVAGFTLLLTGAAGLFFGLVPAWQAARVDVQPALKSGGRGAAARGHSLRDALVVVEIALSVSILVGGGLLFRSFTRLVHVDPGYDARGVQTLRLRLPDAEYRDGRKVAATLHAILDRVAALPGVDRVCLTTGVPFGRTFPDPFFVDGHATPRLQDAPLAWTQWVTPGYFDTLRIPLVTGRTLTPADGERDALVAVVDEELARRQFPGQPAAAALGARVRFPRTDDRWRTIVGVVRHVRHNALNEPPHPQVYGPYDQLEPGWRAEIGRAIDLAVRSDGEPSALVEAIRAQVRAVDRGVPLSHVRTLADATSASIAPRVLDLSLAGGFSFAALLLCLVGVYGVMSGAVTARTREIGVRRALGAAPASVLARVLTRGVRLALVGTTIGLLLSIAVARALQAMLYGVTPRDPLTFAAVAALLLAVAAAGSYLPARRAMRVDPLVALRQE
jgi:predicted permease